MVRADQHRLDPGGAQLQPQDPAALEECREKYKEDVDYYVFTQYLFFQQWGALKEYANQRGVKIIGDAPIYVAMDSADVWAQPGLFQLDEKNVPTEVSGCPPDASPPTASCGATPSTAGT